MNYQQKVVISYIGIILLTSYLFVYYNYKTPVKEGAANIGKTIEKALMKPIKPIKENIEKGFKKTTGFISDLKNIGKKLGQINKKIDEGIKLGFTDTFDLLGCAGEKIMYFNTCFIYYFANLMGETIYSILVRLPVFCIKIFTGLDLNETIDMIWDGIYCFDNFIYGMIGFHFIQWSDDIMNKCFLCKGKPFKDAASKVKNEPSKKFTEASHLLKSLFGEKQKKSKK